MAHIMIYQFKTWDGSTDNVRIARRWGTKAAIADIAKGTVLEQTGVLVDESVVNSDIPGMTVHDYNPELHQGGFQRTVTKGY